MALQAEERRLRSQFVRMKRDQRFWNRTLLCRLFRGASAQDGDGVSIDYFVPQFLQAPRGSRQIRNSQKAHHLAKNTPLA